jgi:hypothetical protein
LFKLNKAKTEAEAEEKSLRPVRFAYSPDRRNGLIERAGLTQDLIDWRESAGELPARSGKM